MDIEELDLDYVIGRLRKYAESSDLSETGHKVYTTAANQLESQQVELFDWIVKSATANTEIESLRSQLQQSEARVRELEATIRLYRNAPTLAEKLDEAIATHVENDDE